jgi:beta-galactosidase
MKPIINLIGISIFLIQSCTISSPYKTVQTRQRPFDDNWKFIRDSAAGAENPDYNDSAWRNLDLPHDWTIEDLPNQFQDSIVGPFSKNSPGRWLSGNTLGGTGWYRKHFVMNKEDKGKMVKILFDGVMTESDVWINGKHLGYHPNGYTAFAYDLTPFLNPAGNTNVLAVRVKNIGHNTRWYSGSGIYRNVSLVVTDPIHVDLWGVYVTTSEISENSASINLEVSVLNSSGKDADIEIKTRLVNKEGGLAGQSEKSEKVAVNESIKSTQTITVNNPDLWSPDSPYLYDVIVDVLSKGEIIDTYNLKTGIRIIKWDTQNGFQINGKTIKLRGGNVHHDNGILGAAAFKRAEQRKIEILKANGFNAIRCSHNPPSTHFLNVCDSLGILVLNELFDAWEKRKLPEDYARYFKDYWQADLETTLLRDRNHPSVIIWSIGNEIIERADPEGLEITNKLVSTVKKFDTTRPVTEAINGFSGVFGGKHTSWDDSAPAFALLDIAGYNYMWKEWEKDHQKYPNRVVMTTESSAIDMYRVYSLVEKYPWIAGDFVWTAMDYLGESGCGAGYIENEPVNYGIYVPQYKKGFGRGWPWYNAWCGEIDIIGNKKPRSYYRDVLWNLSRLEFAVQKPISEGNKEVINGQGWATELQSWTWPGNEGKTMEVSVYTRTDSVRLELNGKIIGEKQVSENQKENAETRLTKDAISQLVARFDVPFEPGELKAIGISDGKEVISKILKTISTPFKLVLKPERNTIKADRNDLAYISVEVQDNNGNTIPDAGVRVNFTITGNGELIATGNGSPDQMASFQQPTCKTFNGKALIVVRPFARPGKITVTATSEGLSSEAVEIQIK